LDSSKPIGLAHSQVKRHEKMSFQIYGFFFPTPYSQIDFEYVFNKFACHLSSIELKLIKLNLNLIIKLNLVELKLDFNRISFNLFELNWIQIKSKLHAMSFNGT